MQGEVQVIIQKGSSTTYKTGAIPYAIISEIANYGTTSPLLSDTILNAFIQQAVDGGDDTINAYDADDNLVGTYHLDYALSAAPSYGAYQFYLLNNDIPDPNTVYITFTINSIENIYLDLFENEVISQNWKFQDLATFTAQGAFSREFRIPYSENNQTALGPLFDVNNSAGAENYFHYKLPAEIRVDTLPIAIGYIRVRKVYRRLDRINEVEIAFYAETPDLVRTIGEKKLSDIAALNDLNEVINYANVTTETADRIWTLCDRGQLWSNAGEPGSRPVQSAANPIYPADLTPAVNWWFLLSNIVKEAGFDLVAGSLQNIIEEYWMPWCNTANLQTTGGTNQYFFRAYPPINFLAFDGIDDNSSYTNMVEVFDNNNDFNATTGVYTASVDGTFTFYVNQYFQGAPQNGTNYIVLEMRVYKNNGFQESYFASFDFFNGPPSITFLFTQSFSKTLLAGDTIFIEYNYHQATNVYSAGIGSAIYTPVDTFEYGQVTLYGLAGNGTTSASYIEINAADITVGAIISYPLNAPDMRQIDLVNDVIKMHNCAIVPSRVIPNRIAIIPQNSYLGTGDVLDWTGKLDVSKDITLQSTVDLQKAQFQFTYTAGEDAYSKLYKDANRVYGDYQVEGYTTNPSTSPSDFVQGNQKITLTTRSTPCAMISGAEIPIPCFYNENLEFVAPGPRALFNALTNSFRVYNDATNSAVITSVPILNHYNQIFVNFDDKDLNWAPEIPPHFQTVTVNPYNNLFNTYWRNYMNELYSPDGRIMEAFFALDLKDILTFSFADKIWIKDSYWRILEINDYKIGGYESTQVKLLKFVDQVQDCAATPVGVSTNGEVTFEDYDGGETAPTEDCCSRYGYFWDEENGVCWAFNNGGQFRNSVIARGNNQPINSPIQSVSNVPSSILNGANLSIASGNGNMLMVGRDLSLTKLVNGSNVLGKNATTNLPGFHLGGGYRNGLSSSSETGWSQSGIVHLHLKDGFSIAGATSPLFVEGWTGEHIEMPDSTSWSCMLNITIQDEMQNGIEIGLYSFGLTKIAGVTYATAVTPITTDALGTGYTYAINIDTTTNTAQHRFILTVNTAPAFPITLIATASLYYQQNKLV